MEVILKKNVDNLGYKNEIVDVKDGYGRNFLIPKGYAILATPSAKKEHEENVKQQSHKEEKLKADAQALADKLNGLVVKVKAKVGESGRIFGSINTIQISEALSSEGINVDRKSIRVKVDSVKEVGTYDAEANLHKEIQQAFQFEVVAE